MEKGKGRLTEGGKENRPQSEPGQRITFAEMCLYPRLMTLHGNRLELPECVFCWDHLICQL